MQYPTKLVIYLLLKLQYKSIECCQSKKKMIERGISSKFDPHTSKARYELIGTLHLWRINVKTTPGFIHIPLDDFFMDNALYKYCR